MVPTGALRARSWREKLERKRPDQVSTCGNLSRGDQRWRTLHSETHFEESASCRSVCVFGIYSNLIEINWLDMARIWKIWILLVLQATERAKASSTKANYCWNSSDSDSQHHFSTVFLYSFSADFYRSVSHSLLAL